MYMNSQSACPSRSGKQNSLETKELLESKLESRDIEISHRYFGRAPYNRTIDFRV